MSESLSRSLAHRAIMALMLMIGFYVLALAIAGGLLFLIYFQISEGSFSIYISIICFIGAIVIIWSIFPRMEKFVQSGPLLTPDQQPRLFSELSSIAKSTGQEMPAEVYIIPDLNAGVSQMGRTSLYKNRRIMVIGLPLLKVLTVSQLRAILAHEFGHYCGGDIKLGPWVFKTRATIISTLWRLRGLFHSPIAFHRLRDDVFENYTIRLQAAGTFGGCCSSPYCRSSNYGECFTKNPGCGSGLGSLLDE